MPWLNSRFAVDDALSRQLDIWELLVDEWGNIAAGADPTSASFPAEGSIALPTPAAVAIGPRSTIDRCWIAYDLQKLVPSLNLWDYARRCSVGAPLNFAQPGDGKRARTKIDVGTGFVTVLPTRSLDGYTPLQGSYATNPYDDTRYRTAYLKADGSAGVFGHTNATAYWMSPLLHLYWYLRPPLFPAPLKRFPLNVAFQKGGAVAGTETLIGMIPVCGRKTINVTVVVDIPGGTATCRLALIQQIKSEVGTDVMQEATVATQAAIADNASFRFAPITNANSDYLMIYLTPVTQAGNLDVMVNATDD